MPGDFDNLQPMKGPIFCRRSNGRVPFAPSAFVFVLFFVGLVPTFTMRSVAAQADFRWVTDVVPRLGYSYSWTNSTPLAVDQTGNSYLVSPLLGAVTNGTNVLVSRGGSDVLLMKYDRNGILNWAKRFGGDQDEAGIAITVNALGNCYLTGISRGSTSADFGQITITNNYPGYLFVAKLDSSGNTIWADKVGGPNSGPLPDGIASDAAGNCYITGILGPQVTSFGSLTATNIKAAPFLAKCDSTGSFAWVKVALSSSFLGLPLMGDKVVSGDDERVYWLGEYSGTVTLGGTVLASKTQDDLFWAQLNESGDVISLNRIGARSSALTTSVALDTQGHAYFASSFNIANLDFGGLSLTNHGSYDAFVAKCDLAGHAFWVRGLGGKSADYGAGIAVDGEGNCYVVGSFLSSDLDFQRGVALATRGNFDVFITKFDALGNLVWVKQGGGTQYDIAFGVGLDAAGNCYVTGIRDGSASFDSIQMADVGLNTTFFLAKIVEPPALNLAFAAQQAFLYWPASKSDFSLESSTELSTNANWSPVTSPFVILGDQRVVIDDLKAGNRFYRLKE